MVKNHQSARLWRPTTHHRVGVDSLRERGGPGRGYDGVRARRYRRTETVQDTSVRRSSPDIHELGEIEAYRAFVPGWMLAAMPLGHGDFRVRWITQDLPGMMLNRYSTETALREVYVKDPGATAFVLVLPAASGDAFRVRGHRLEPMTLALLQPHTEYEIISPAGGHTLEAHVTDELLASIGLERWLEPTFDVRPERAHAVAFARLVAPMVTAGSTHDSVPRVDQRAVLDALSRALDSADQSAPPAARAHLYKTYRRALAVIEAEPDPMLTVAEVAARLGVTARTLRYAFGHAVGISPYQYMLRRRMTIVRDALLDPGRPERTVLELLLSMGISHQGEFAGQYRRLFGESPSETRASAVARRRGRPRRDSLPRLLRAAR